MQSLQRYTTLCGYDLGYDYAWRRCSGTMLVKFPREHGEPEVHETPNFSFYRKKFFYLW